MRDNPGFYEDDESFGGLVQVSRLANPLVNEVVIGLPDKNLFNASHPNDDVQFATYVTNPTLPALLEILFGVTAPTAFPRADLVQIFLTGVTGLNQDGSNGEIMRLNTEIPPVPSFAQNNLGVIAGDLAGYPNGRRPGDDTVDISLRAVMGVLLPPADAPDGQLPYTDGARQHADQFDDVFPYLGEPLPGSPNDETTREANLIGENLDPPVETDQRGFASLTLVQGAEFSFRFLFRNNLDPPYTANVLDGGPNGTVIWAVDVEDTGDQEVILDANNAVGGDPLIFADGFESGDTSVWTSATPGGTAKGAEATPIIAGPFR